MKVSEAMRIGASKTGKCRGQYINRKGTKTCALGAALYGMGYTTDDAITGVNIDDLLGIPIAQVYSHPIMGSHYWSLFSIITNLNDVRGWSRKRIANWLESIGM